jgi:hypothetical protein
MITNRSELIGLIKDAFGNVSRQGGVSWTETEVLDMYGTDAERKAARAKDTDRRWTELIDGDGFFECGIGGFCFLDPIGFRYYLPAAICISLRKRRDTAFTFNTLEFHLQLDSGPLPWNLDLLDEAQLRAIAEYHWFQLAEGEWGYQPDGSYIWLDDVERELVELSFKVTFSDLPEFWQSFLTPIT